MKRLSRYLLVIVASVLLLLGFSFVYNGDYHLEVIKPVGNRPPKVTVIAIWTSRGGSPPIYLPYFFQSVEANPQIDLLLVQVDRQFGCSSFSTAPNVQEICFSEDQYYQLHVDFLCKKWECTDDNKSTLLEYLRRTGEVDPNHSFFRLFRNGIFKPWIDPATTIWGWCDLDTFWGNFTRAFPWDVAHDFDVLVAASQPDFSNNRALFTRGHMTFIRHSTEVMEKFFTFPKFTSFSSYFSQPQTLPDAEESEFSHFIFSEQDAFTFLTFEAMVNSWDTIMLSDKGVFYTTIQKENLTPDSRARLFSLIQSADERENRPTFSPDVDEEEAQLIRDGHHYDGSMWFDAKYLTYVKTGWVEPYEREQKAYIMRRNPYGQVTQRIEPREPYLIRDGELVVDECLYKHWQEEKRQGWFKKIPAGGINPGQVFVQLRNVEAEIWDEAGIVVYSMGTTDL
ncbi:hypothetical protein M0805_000514 [Coniferiporia weirii]|nr:hypothetical protein M0805_000514 [Coniferiporia weirii]